jgi:DNA primase
MPTRWIDFRALKEKVTIRDVLARYGFLEKLREKGPGKLVGSCPIHAGSNGNAFHVNIEKNVFNCFAGCGGGNVLDFVSKMEKCGIREAGEKLASWFGLQFSRPDTHSHRAKHAHERRLPPHGSSPTSKGNPAETTTVEAINALLTSPLKTLDPNHPYLAERGLTPDTIRTFGLGFCVAAS